MKFTLENARPTVHLELTWDEYVTLRMLHYRRLRGNHPTRFTLQAGFDAVDAATGFSPSKADATLGGRV